jgi:hypothetical protein
MSDLFSDVQSGSSTTAGSGVYQYDSGQVAAFLDANQALQIEGAPIPTPAWFDRDVWTLSDFLDKKYPPWGVIVAPGGGRRVLVWFDAAGQVRVVDVTGHNIANEVIKAPFESPDSSYMENLLNRINELAAGLPTPEKALDSLTLIVGGLVLVAALGFLRK